MIKSKSLGVLKDQAGTLLIELALVVGILAMAAMCGLEIAHFLQRSQSGVSLTRELGSSILRDCYDACDPAASEACIGREVERVARIARGVDTGINVRTTVLMRNVNAECIFQNSPTAWRTFSASSSSSAFKSPRAAVTTRLINGMLTDTQAEQQGIIISAEVEARYSPLTGYALNIFGRDSYYYHGTIM